ncbi:hypothetical protein PG984_012114 [Apiospora sp. TS-2023a]
MDDSRSMEDGGDQVFLDRRRDQIPGAMTNTALPHGAIVLNSDQLSLHGLNNQAVPQPVANSFCGFYFPANITCQSPGVENVGNPFHADNFFYGVDDGVYQSTIAERVASMSNEGAQGLPLATYVADDTNRDHGVFTDLPALSLWQDGSTPNAILSAPESVCYGSEQISRDVANNPLLDLPLEQAPLFSYMHAPDANTPLSYDVEGGLLLSQGPAAGLELRIHDTQHEVGQQTYGHAVEPIVMQHERQEQHPAVEAEDEYGGVSGWPTRPPPILTMDNVPAQTSLLAVSAPSRDQDEPLDKPRRERGRGSRCLFCYVKNRKCTLKGDAEMQCPECTRAQLPLRCIPHRLETKPLFAKWCDSDYRTRMQWASLQWSEEQFKQDVCHFAGGPSLSVMTRNFTPSSNDQILVWGKSVGGWQAVATSPVGLATLPSEEAIARYIEACVPLCCQTYNTGLLDLVWQKRTSDLVATALRLWTANCLLLRGWETPFGPAVSDQCSPYYQNKPAPRVVQNQLDAIVEKYMAICETALLKKLENTFKRVEEWPEVYATLIILVWILEKDIWRLMFWTRHRQEAYKWRHPETPETLIQKDIAHANILLTIRQIIGYVPDHFKEIATRGESASR